MRHHYPYKIELFMLLLRLFISFNFAKASENDSTPASQTQPSRLSPRKVNQKDRRFFKFVTRPDIDAPIWQISVRSAGPVAPGYWFLAPYEDLDQQQPGEAWVGPHIYDGTGELIWSGTGLFQHWNAFDFGLTTIGGQQMMTVLVPHMNAGFILDNNYRVWKRVPLDRINADMHAFRVIDDGKRALLLTHHRVQTTPEEAAVVGFNRGCSVTYNGFAELDVNQPESPVFTWDAYPNIGLDEGTYNRDRLEAECTRAWDLLHLNAVDKFPDGDYLISSRHTDALYKISHVDGSIVWRLGGLKSDFDFIGPGNPVFSRQHHAYVVSQNGSQLTISLFDNAIGTGPAEHETNKKARGMLLSLNTTAMTVSILAEFANPAGHTVSSRGSFQILQNGNAFLCWTYSSHISEHTPDGKVVTEAILPVAAHSYRAFKHPWIGQPTQPPDVVSEVFSTKGGKNHTLIYVSWNGATEVARWAVFAANEEGIVNGTILARAVREGFEMAIVYPGVADYVVVEAFDGKAESLGRSEIVRTIPLEEQELHRVLHSESYEGDEQQAHSSDDEDAQKSPETSSPAVKRSSIFPFLLGFASCCIIGAVLHWHTRRREVPWRRPMRWSPKYELLMQEHLH